MSRHTPDRRLRERLEQKKNTVAALTIVRVWEGDPLPEEHEFVQLLEASDDPTWDGTNMRRRYTVLARLSAAEDKGQV